MMLLFNPLKEILNDPVPGRNVEFYKAGSGRLLDELNDIYEHGEKPAETTGITTLDVAFRWYEGFVYCFTGYPGNGKSELLNFLAIEWAKRKRGRKIAMYSPESYPVKSLAISLIQAYTGVYFDPNRPYSDMISRQAYDDAIGFLNDAVTIIDLQDVPMSHELLNQFQELRDKGHEFFITDPFNYLGDLSGSTNISQNLSAALSRMKKFAVDNKCINTIIEHPKSHTGSRKDRPKPSPYTLYGGSMWFNKMDVIVSVDRLEGSHVEVASHKVKLQRIVGTPQPITLEWCHGTYRSLEIELN